MLSIQTMPASTAKWDDLSLKSPLDSAQLHKITLELESIVMAIAALTQIDQPKMSQIAQDLRLESIVSDWLNQWPLVQVTPNQQLDVSQLQALILIVHHLAQHYQTLLRQRINDWEQILQFDRLPLESPALAEYIGNFITMYQTRLSQELPQSFEALTEAAMNLLVELLFYGSNQGHQRLWSALLSRFQIDISADPTA
jgi:hypothetical protein